MFFLSAWQFVFNQQRADLYHSSLDVLLQILVPHHTNTYKCYICKYLMYLNISISRLINVFAYECKDLYVLKVFINMWSKHLLSLSYLCKSDVPAWTVFFFCFVENVSLYANNFSQHVNWELIRSYIGITIRNFFIFFEKGKKYN